MIHLLDVSKSYRTVRGTRIVLHPTSLTIPTNQAVAILGRNGAGKSTLLRMISGIEQPDEGEVIRTTRLSWVLGQRPGANGKMTGRQIARLIARLNGVDEQETVDFVEEFAELGEYMDMPASTYSSGMNARLSFGLSLAIDFDCYLIDEATSVGDQWFRDKCVAAFETRRQQAGILMVSHNASTIRQYCDMGLVLHRGYLVPFDDLEEAIHFYANG